MLRHQLRARVGQRLGEVSLRGELGDHRVRVTLGKFEGGIGRDELSSISCFCFAKPREKLLPKAAYRGHPRRRRHRLRRRGSC